nr:uncharacterized protein LOC128706255 isoform X1 [Cherax quadricarinatus]
MLFLVLLVVTSVLSKPQNDEQPDVQDEPQENVDALLLANGPQDDLAALILPRPPVDSENFHEPCNYYCRKPAGPHRGDFYCCGPESLPIIREQRHPGRCPPALTTCTSRRAFAAPPVCPHDGHCPRAQKCCFDTCLDYHTCKPAH